MSAGKGIQHSEFNSSEHEDASLLQIWVFPKLRNIEPRYDQKRYDPARGINKFQTLVSPVKDADTMWINQDAYFSIGEFDEGSNATYSIKNLGNGAYLFIIEGDAVVAGESLKRRDAIGVFDTENFDIQITNRAKILVIDVPME